MAEILSRHTEGLSLSGLTSLSDAAAEFFRQPVAISQLLGRRPVLGKGRLAGIRGGVISGCLSLAEALLDRAIRLTIAGDLAVVRNFLPQQDTVPKSAPSAAAFNSGAVTARSEPRYRPSLAA